MKRLLQSNNRWANASSGASGRVELCCDLQLRWEDQAAEERPGVEFEPFRPRRFPGFTIGRLRTDDVISAVRLEVHVTITRMELEALVAVLVERHGDDVAGEVAGVLILQDVFVATEWSWSEESSRWVGSSADRRRHHGCIDVAYTRTVPVRSPVKVNSRLPLMREGALDVEVGRRRRFLRDLFG